MLTKVVVKKKDGTLIKGLTGDFLPNKNTFHVNTSPADTTEVVLDELKAVFFVKTLEVNKSLHDCKRCVDVNNIQKHSIGKSIQVVFRDGEIIKGFSHSLHMDGLGFLMVPADLESNNERIFVVLSFVKDVQVDGVSHPVGKSL